MLPFGPRATLHNYGAEFFSVDLGTSQYLYIVTKTEFALASPHWKPTRSVEVCLTDSGPNMLNADKTLQTKQASDNCEATGVVKRGQMLEAETETEAKR